MREVLEKENLIRPLKVGEIVEGKIIGQGKSSVFLDLGARGTGIIYGKEFFEAKEELKNLKKGDSVFTKIIDLENEDGYVELSMSGASKELSWLKLSQAKERGEEISVKISGANKGGLISEVFGIQGFLPVSQLDSSHYPRVENGNQEKILRELQKFLGKELTVKIFDLSPKEGKLILSEKAKATEKIKKLLENYNAGDVVEGKITGITDFGAFLRFSSSAKASEDRGEGLEGLIHISELDWKLIEDPTEVVKISQTVKAKIIDISGNKVSLSLKALKKDPWTDIGKKYKKGDIVTGRVSKFNPFGAFVQITPEIQGLCHISEFGNRGRMEAKLEIGKKYDFQILSIDSKEHRMSLKLVE